MSAVVPPSDSNPSGANGPNHNIEVKFPSDVLKIITEKDQNFATAFNQSFSLKQKVPLGRLRAAIFADDPFELDHLFFHYLNALPEFAKTEDFSSPRNEFIFFNNLCHLALGDFPNEKMRINKRTWSALIYQIMLLKSKNKENEVLVSLLDKALDFSVNNLFQLSQPVNLRETGEEAFNPAEYLEGILTQLGRSSAKQQIGSEISALYSKISKEKAFADILDRAVTQAERIDEIAASQGDFSQSGMERVSFEVHEAEAFKKRTRVGFDRISDGFVDFVRDNEGKTGYNGKFLGLLQSDIKNCELDSEPDLSVNFHIPIDPEEGDDLDIFRKKQDTVLNLIQDFIKIGYEDFAFANFFQDYGFSTLTGHLNCFERMISTGTQDLVLEYLSRKSSSSDFSTFSQLDSLKKIKNPFLQNFIDFLDALKRIILHNEDIDVKVFLGDDEGQALSQWQEGTGDKKVLFNNRYYAAQASDAYNISINIMKYDPSEKLITNDDVGTCCIADDISNGKVRSVLVSVPEALPLVVWDIANQAQQRIKDGDVFTLTDAEEFTQYVHDSFEGVNDGITETDVTITPVFSNEDQELEPDLHQVVFVEHRDDNDGDDDTWSDSKVPDGSLALS